MGGACLRVTSSEGEGCSILAASRSCACLLCCSALGCWLGLCAGWALLGTADPAGRGWALGGAGEEDFCPTPQGSGEPKMTEVLVQPDCKLSSVCEHLDHCCLERLEEPRSKRPSNTGAKLWGRVRSKLLRQKVLSSLPPSLCGRGLGMPRVHPWVLAALALPSAGAPWDSPHALGVHGAQ